MKLGVEMESQKPNMYIVSEDGERKKMHTNYFKVAFFTLLTLLAVAAIVLTAVYVGGRLARGGFKYVLQEATDFKYELQTTGGQTVKETISVTDTEEDIGLDDGSHIIFDYGKGFMVLKVVEDGEVTCYVTQFDRRDIRAPRREDLNQLGSQHENLNVSDETDYYIDRSSSVNPDILSERSRDACDGAKIYWMTKYENTVAEGKRQRRGWKCRYYCYPTWPLGSGWRCGVTCTF